MEDLINSLFFISVAVCDYVVFDDSILPQYYLVPFYTFGFPQGETSVIQLRKPFSCRLGAFKTIFLQLKWLSDFTQKSQVSQRFIYENQSKKKNYQFQCMRTCQSTRYQSLVTMVYRKNKRKDFIKTNISVDP